MSLIKSKSKQAFEHNMKAEMDAGKPQAQSLAIAYDMKRRAPKRKKMAEGGGVLDSIVDTVKKSFEDPPAPNKKSPNYNPRKLQAKKTEDFQKGFGYAEGGEIDDIDSSEIDVVRNKEKLRRISDKSPKGINKQHPDRMEGTSEAGHYAKYKTSDDSKDYLKKKTKEKHEQTLKEMKSMPKPKLKGLAEGGMVKPTGPFSVKSRKMLDEEAQLMSQMSPEDETEHIEYDDEHALHSEKMAKGGHVGGMISKAQQPAEEAQDERHSSIAAAIMAKKARQMKLDSDSDDDEMLMMAEGGQVDLDHNSMEEPNSFYELNEHAALKENYDEDMEDMHQPMDSNEHADEREANSENKLDMISAIRRKMASRRQF